MPEHYPQDMRDEISSWRLNMRLLVILSLFLISFSTWSNEDKLPHICNGKTASLFKSNKVLNIDIIADFEAINKNHRDSANSPATIIYRDSKKQPHYVLGHLEARGNSRFSYCPWRPLKLRFEQKDNQKKIIAGTGARNTQSAFALALHKKYLSFRQENPERVSSGLKSGLFANLGKKMKIVTHCGISKGFINNPTQEMVNRNILFEYSIYQVLDSLSTTTLKTRLAKINYRDPKGKKLETQYAFFRETPKALAKRCQLKKIENGDNLTSSENSEFQVEFLNTFVSNYDYGTSGHNVFHLKSVAGVKHYVPYDFDLTWVINPTYGKNAGEKLEAEVKYMKNYYEGLGDEDRSRAVAQSLYIQMRLKTIQQKMKLMGLKPANYNHFVKWFRAKNQVVKNFLKKYKSENSTEYKNIELSLKKLVAAKRGR